MSLDEKLGIKESSARIPDELSAYCGDGQRRFLQRARRAGRRRSCLICSGFSGGALLFVGDGDGKVVLHIVTSLGLGLPVSWLKLISSLVRTVVPHIRVISAQLAVAMRRILRVMSGKVVQAVLRSSRMRVVVRVLVTRAYGSSQIAIVDLGVAVVGVRMLRIARSVVPGVQSGGRRVLMRCPASGTVEVCVVREAVERWQCMARVHLLLLRQVAYRASMGGGGVVPAGPVVRCIWRTLRTVGAGSRPAVMVPVLTVDTAIVVGREGGGWIRMVRMRIVWLMWILVGARVMLLLLMVLRIGDRARAVSGGVHRGTILPFMSLGKVVLHQELVLELLMSSRLLIRLGNAHCLCVPRGSTMRLSVRSRRVAHQVLSTSSRCSSGEPGSLRSLPDMMVHGATYGGMGHVGVGLMMVHLSLGQRINKGVAS